MNKNHLRLDTAGRFFMAHLAQSLPQMQRSLQEGEAWPEIPPVTPDCSVITAITHHKLADFSETVSEYAEKHIAPAAQDIAQQMLAKGNHFKFYLLEIPDSAPYTSARIGYRGAAVRVVNNAEGYDNTEDVGMRFDVAFIVEPNPTLTD